MGDLIVTCTSMHSRNRRAGILIGQGKSAQEAMTEVGAVVEGYYAAESIYQLSQREGVEMPLCRSVYEVLYHGVAVPGCSEQPHAPGQKGRTNRDHLAVMHNKTTGTCCSGGFSKFYLIPHFQLIPRSRRLRRNRKGK